LTPWSRPNSSRKRASFSSLPAVAITVAPARFASCTAAIPTPLAPAWIKTVSPFWSRPNSKRQSSAVPNGIGTHAATSTASPSGTTNVKPAGTATRSACEPCIMIATTRSPTLRSRTSAPTARIVPPHW
jgi:hypothetical protein